MDWVESLIPITSPIHDLHRLRGGVYGHLHDSTLAFVQLRSPLRGGGVRRWSHKDLDWRVKQFTMDPTRDLLAILEIPDVAT